MERQLPERDQLLLTESNLPVYLSQVGLVHPGEPVQVEKAGEGNINWVRRARTPQGRSWVIKQARPALERFPQYRVSTERVIFESRYYAEVAPFDAEGVCPGVVFFDPGERVLILEDLGDPEDLEAALARGGDVMPAARSLGRFLGAVHAGTQHRPELAARFANGAMQRLHGEHIFCLPYRENDFPLSPAVTARAAALRNDAALLERIDAAYARYLEPRGVLNHGDVQPSNVLLTAAGARLLDAEIAHVGDPAFDLGILIAHLLVHGVARGEPASGRGAVEAAWASYCEAHASAATWGFPEVARYAGIELLRRSVGAARVPAVRRDEAALAVVEAGARLVLEPPDDPALLG